MNGISGISGNALVLCKKGLTEIKDVKKHDQVWTNKGWTDVVDAPSSVEDLFKITTKSGKEISCSSEQLLHTPSGFLALKHFKNDAFVSNIIGSGWADDRDTKLVFDEQDYHHNTNLNINLPKKLTVDFCYLLGHIYGDGSFQPRAIKIAASDDHPEIKNKIIKCIKSCFNYVPQIYSSNKVACTKISVCSVKLIEFLKLNKLAKVKSNNMIFPKVFFMASYKHLGAFISGLLDSDGHVDVKYKRFTISLVAKDFIDALNCALWAWNIGSKVRFQKRSLPRRPLYYLSVNGKRSQDNFISLVEESVKAKKAIISNNNQHFVKKRDNLLSIYKNKDFFFTGKKNINSRISFTMIEKFGEENFLKKEIPCILLDKILNVEKASKDQVFNLKLTNKETFFANGFAISSLGKNT